MSENSNTVIEGRQNVLHLGGCRHVKGKDVTAGMVLPEGVIVHTTPLDMQGNVRVETSARLIVHFQKHERVSVLGMADQEVVDAIRDALKA